MAVTGVPPLAVDVTDVIDVGLVISPPHAATTHVIIKLNVRLVTSTTGLRDCSTTNMARLLSRRSLFVLYADNFDRLSPTTSWPILWLTVFCRIRKPGVRPHFHYYAQFASVICLHGLPFFTVFLDLSPP
jgi:hypothetical protein